jgi:hypothetical protein
MHVKRFRPLHVPLTKLALDIITEAAAMHK